MILTFSHIVNGECVPLLNENGSEVTLSVDAPTKTAAMSAQQVVEFCATKGIDVRVRTVTL